MKAGVVTPGQRDTTRIIDMAAPEIKRGEVLIRALEVGVDGTDMEINNGEYGQAPEGERYLVPGHECLGEVVDPADSGLEKGQLVVPIVRRPDGCRDCQSGQYDMCTDGDYQECGIKGLHGFMREFFAERPEFLVEIPERIRHIAVLTEPLSVVEKGVRHAVELHRRSARPVKTALVLGAGPLGLLAVACFRQQDISTYGLDIVPDNSLKAQIVKGLGASYIDGREMELSELPDKTSNLDVVFEATGNSSVMFKAMLALGKNGVLCLAGLPSVPKPLPVKSDALLSGLVLGNKTVFGTVSSNRSQYEKSVQLLVEAEDRWPGAMSRIITGRFKLDDFTDALHLEDATIKNVVQVTEV